MGRSKEAWLREGAGDLKEAVVEDVPEPGDSVKVRGLSAGYSLQAQSEAREVRIVDESTISTIDGRKLEILQFVHGVVDPVFTEEEAAHIADAFGPAWRKVVDKIDDLSALGKEAMAETADRFQPGGTSETRTGVGHGNGTGSPGPDLSPRDGAEAREVGVGDVHG